MATVNEIISGIESKMEKSVAALRVDLASLRAGRATPSLLEKVMVDYYGSPTPVTQVASVTVPEPRMIVIQPWEKNILPPFGYPSCRPSSTGGHTGCRPRCRSRAARSPLPSRPTPDRRRRLSVCPTHRGKERRPLGIRPLPKGDRFAPRR